MTAFFSVIDCLNGHIALSGAGLDGDSALIGADARMGGIDRPICIIGDAAGGGVIVRAGCGEVYGRGIALGGNIGRGVTTDGDAGQRSGNRHDRGAGGRLSLMLRGLSHAGKEVVGGAHGQAAEGGAGLPVGYGGSIVGGAVAVLNSLTGDGLRSQLHAAAGVLGHARRIHGAGIGGLGDGDAVAGGDRRSDGHGVGTILIFILEHISGAAAIDGDCRGSRRRGNGTVHCRVRVADCIAGDCVESNSFFQPEEDGTDTGEICKCRDIRRIFVFCYFPTNVCISVFANTIKYCFGVYIHFHVAAVECIVVFRDSCRSINAKI